MGDKLYAEARIERCKGLVKIKKLLKLGHFPTREKQSYTPISKHAQTSYGNQVNCFEHACLNLTNEQLEKLKLKYDDKYLFDIKSYSYEEQDSMEQTFVDRLKSFGLIAKPCPRDFVPKQENQWKVALYFGFSFASMDTDYHLLKQEKDGSWSSKIGWSDEVEFLDELPEKYKSSSGTQYLLQQTYIITNPYAKERNTEDKNKGDSNGKEL